jgi:AraC-like DNA-binding protein
MPGTLNEPRTGQRATTGGMKPLRTQRLNVTRESMVSMRVVRGLVEAVEQAGVSALEFLRAARIEPALLDTPEACIPRAEMYRLCGLAVDMTRDQAFGLHWAERLSANTFNPISHLVAHAATLRQGFESLFQFHRLVNDQPSFQLCESDDEVTVHCLNLTAESVAMQRFIAEMLVIGFFRIIRSFSPQARPERVSFEYAAPEYRGEYTRVFESTERFEQPFTGIVFDRALMNTASPHKDEDVHDALRIVAERRILRITQRVPSAMRVLELVVQRGASGPNNMEDIARSLGLSARSLRRRLFAEGKTYHAIMNEALAIIAKQHLRDKHRTIQETAYEMGFADATTFHRAFKRWTGMTPSAYRAAPH